MLGRHGAPTQLENEFPIGQLVALVGAFDGIRQLAGVQLCVSP